MTALATGAAAQNAALEKPAVKLGIGGKIQLPYLAVNIAQERGYFKEQGLTVEFNEFKGGSDSLKALVGGSVDFIAGAYEHTLYLQAKGETITSIALQNNSFGVVVALTKGLAAKYKSPKDLVALNDGRDRARIVDRAGAQPAAVESRHQGRSAVDHRRRRRQPSVTVKAGRLDGEANFDPVITRLTLDGDLVPVVDTRTKAGLDYLYGGPFAGSAISTTPDFIKTHPKTVQALANGMVKALHWLQTASLDDIANTLPPEFYAGNKEFYKKAVQPNREMLSKDGIVTPALADNTRRILSSFNEGVKNAKIDMAKTYDASFAQNANKAMH